jgi:hypothetical protein
MSDEKGFKQIWPYPYSDDCVFPEMCNWSGSGFNYCTDSIRKKSTICKDCPHNPDVKKRGKLG